MVFALYTLMEQYRNKKKYIWNVNRDSIGIFTKAVFSGDMEEIQIPAGKIFVMGDNRAASTDSRHESVGLVDEEDLLGKVILKW